MHERYTRPCIRVPLDQLFVKPSSCSLECNNSNVGIVQAAQRKALDVLNSVGLSDSVLRLIDRRQRLDKWLTYGGMVLVVLLLGAYLWWSSVRHRRRP